VTFLSPLGGLVALAVFVPLVAFAVAERSRRRVSAALALPETRSVSRAAVTTALLLIAALLGLAATQPTLVSKSAREVRQDAAAFFVIDTSRSMLASSSATSPNRFARAQAFAVQLRAKLPDVRVGLASMTDRVLPHLFVSADREAFDATMQKTIGIERPPPTDGFNTVITTLGALTRVATDNFFPAESRRRLLVVLTDGESNRFVDSSVGALFKRRPVVKTIYVRFWGPRERVYLPSGEPDPAYRLDPSSSATIEHIAEATDGVAIEREDVGAAADAARSMLGSGPKAADKRERRRLDLAPYLALGVFAPLGFLLYRRNL
jgi:von Willebrand factor type A domain